MKRNTHTGSQHFIKSPAIVQALLNKSSIKSTDTVYDIGAGSGVIASVLARKVNRVVAIEVEPKTADILRRNMATLSNVKVVEGDFLAMPLPDEPYSVFANIPFHISSDILSRFFNITNPPRVMYLIVQKQFGQKLVSSEKGRFTSQLGMTLGAEYAIKIVVRLNKTDFSPPPAVDTVLVEIKHRDTPLVEKKTLNEYKAYTEKCFSNQTFMSKQPLHVIGATPGLSPSRLTISQWVTLFNASRSQGHK